MKIKLLSFFVFFSCYLQAQDSLVNNNVDGLLQDITVVDTTKFFLDSTVSFSNLDIKRANQIQDSVIVSKNKMPFFTDAPTFNKGRFIAVGSSTLVALAGSYYHLNNAWWSGQKTKFKFDGGYKVLDMFSLGKDAVYAMNLDKFGHFYGGHLVGEMFYDMVKWSGKSREQSLKWAGVFGTSVDLFI